MQPASAISGVLPHDCTGPIVQIYSSETLVELKFCFADLKPLTRKHIIKSFWLQVLPAGNNVNYAMLL